MPPTPEVRYPPEVRPKASVPSDPNSGAAGGLVQGPGASEGWRPGAVLGLLEWILPWGRLDLW